MRLRTQMGSIGIAAILIAVNPAAGHRAQGPAAAGITGGSHPVAAPNLSPIATVEDRYQSYNVEMLEVTGGKFWKPYGPELEAALRQPAPATTSSTASSGGDTPAGMNPALYQYRPPIDLTNARLQKLAAALGPAYVR